MEAILQFQPVSADVLHGRRAHAAGDKGQVFQTGVALLQGPGYQVVPGFACGGLHDPVCAVFIHQRHAPGFHLEHQGLHIARQHDVAAAAQHHKALRQQRLRLLGRQFGQCRKLCIVRDAP